MKKNEEIIVLKTYPDFPEAEKDRQTLKKKGIECFVSEEAFSKIITGQATECRLSVLKKDRKKAEKILG